MTGEAALLDPTAPEWGEALRWTAHDMYHVPEYVVLDARLSHGTPTAFWYRNGGRHLLMPLILRDVPDSDLRDAVSQSGGIRITFTAVIALYAALGIATLVILRTMAGRWAGADRAAGGRDIDEGGQGRDGERVPYGPRRDGR